LPTGSFANQTSISVKLPLFLNIVLSRVHCPDTFLFENIGKKPVSGVVLHSARVVISIKRSGECSIPDLKFVSLTHPSHYAKGDIL